MKLYELLGNYRNSVIIAEIARLDGEAHYPSYSGALSEMRDLTPKVSDRTIIGEWRTDDSDEWHRICIRDSNNEIWASDFVPWEEMLGMDVKWETLGSPLTFLADVVWDMTFYGYTADVVRRLACRVLDANADTPP
ncbi:MAG: DUF6557 family protein [Chloroflexota bacterium]